MRGEGPGAPAQEIIFFYDIWLFYTYKIIGIWPGPSGINSHNIYLIYFYSFARKQENDLV